jgi:hypothetical protein
MHKTKRSKKERKERNRTSRTSKTRRKKEAQRQVVEVRAQETHILHKRIETTTRTQNVDNVPSGMLLGVSANSAGMKKDSMRTITYLIKCKCGVYLVVVVG